jgi:DNA-directed RNA polymerase subunit M/transcription elongation factor TFIIS
MTITLPTKVSCPKCGNPIRTVTIEAHRSNKDEAVQEYTCAECGHSETRTISLKPENKEGK